MILVFVKHSDDVTDWGQLSHPVSAGPRVTGSRIPTMTSPWTRMEADQEMLNRC